MFQYSENRRNEAALGNEGLIPNGGEGMFPDGEEEILVGEDEEIFAGDKPGFRDRRPGSAGAAAEGLQGAPQPQGTLVAGRVLLSEPGSLRRRWESVQVGFVDDPRQAVGEADSLVSSVIEELVDGFRQQRQRLEAQWSRGAQVSTDELRDAFQRYREFFERLLQV